MRDEPSELERCESAPRKKMSSAQGPASLDDLAGEFESLEYEEDAYYSTFAVTPSFDEVNEGENDGKIVVHLWKDANEDIDEILVICEDERACETKTKAEDAQSGGDEPTKIGEKRRQRILERIRPILERLGVRGNYEKIMRFVRRRKAEDASLHTGGYLSPTDSIASDSQELSVEEQERQKEEWRAELAKVEEEIQTLRNVLENKIRMSQYLKRKLGINVWKELSDDVNQGIRNVKESQVYQNVGEKIGQFTRTVSENSLFQKTESVFKSTAEKTTSILGGFGSGLQMKLGQMRNSDSFRSLEEKMGTAYENVKTKVVPSRSNSTQSFDEALRETESRRASQAPSATSPTIPEEKVL